ncbi:hypothetical protein Cni_G25792 [Canna indica]|uniref:Uncharacterized protein n=1 Tax=Canna indica TaxID=4628 RepID=A0AAQ3KYE1_9LILI|nr:hypothetical protein Cni_G25792 [Canna indica]
MDDVDEVEGRDCTITETVRELMSPPAEKDSFRARLADVSKAVESLTWPRSSYGAFSFRLRSMNVDFGA